MYNMMFIQATIISIIGIFAVIDAGVVRPDGRIVNGSDALPGQVPFAVSFRSHNNHICGGSIIDQNHVLTAAHCVVSTSVPFMSVQYGTINISTDGPNVINVINAIHHPDYVPGKGYKNDVAVLTLETNIVFNRYVQPVQLPEPNAPTPGNQPAMLSGWGFDHSGGHVMPTLQEVNITVYNDTECERIHQNTGPTDRKFNICAGVPEGGKGQCSGDSGGPLVCNGVQIGTVSWSVKPCTRKGYPGVFAKVSTQVEWIHQQIQSDAHSLHVQ